MSPFATAVATLRSGLGRRATRTNLRRGLRRFLLAPLLCGGLSVPRLWAYGEDTRSGEAARSTFHYDLVLALAQAAGFTADEADLVATCTEATDTGSFGSLSGRGSCQVQNTTRTGPYGLYWHFSRRPAAMQTDATRVYAGARATCDLFTSRDLCVDGVPELSEIETWALTGTWSPSVYGVPQPEVALSGFAAVRRNRQRLARLAIYLHALEDSYSHEHCMKTVEFRGHKSEPAECGALSQHWDLEYGPTSEDSSVSYTQEAASATFMALSESRDQQGLSRCESAPTAAMEEWALQDTATERAAVRSDAVCSIVLE